MKIFKKVTALFVVLVCLFGSGCGRIEQPQWLKETICEHDFDEQEIIKESTCTAKGLKVEICSECGETQIVRIKALGHDIQIDNAVPPTCIQSGWTEGSHCVRCNEILTPQRLISEQAHTVATIEGVAPTCASDGLSEGKQCSVCGEILLHQEIILATGDHVDYNNDFVCNVCEEDIYIFDDESKYIEVEVMDGENVAGNWYRLYRPEDYLETQYALPGSIWDDNWLYGSCMTIMAARLGGDWGDGYLYGAGPMGWYLKEMKSKVTDEYIDVYLAAGIYTEAGGASVEITNSTTIEVEEIYADYIKRLVVI